MTLLLEAAIKVSVVIAIGLTGTILFRQRPAALRHWILTTAIAASLALPLMMSVAPSWRLPIATTLSEANRITPLQKSESNGRISIATTVQYGPASQATNRARITPSAIVVVIWIIGVVLNLAGLAVGLTRLRRTAARAAIVHDGPWAETARTLGQRFSLSRPVCLLQSDEPALLMTWGLIRPKVLLPSDAPSWHADRIRVVLAHELAHVQRWDWIVQIGSELLRSACWFNPLVWLASSRLRFESERACDDAVVNLGVSGGEYAEHLLDLARQFGRARHNTLPAVAIIPRQSSLERRITAMLNAQINRRPLSRASRLVTFAFVSAAVVPIALFAQNRFSTISGTVVDPSNAFLPGVTVVAVDTARGVRHEVLTNRTGGFEIVGLPDGPYMLEAGVPGFETYRQKVALDGQDVSRDITLQVGALQETIAVTRDGAPPSFEGQRFGPPRPASCGPSQTAADTGAVRIGGQIRQPRKLRHVSPVYPTNSPAGAVMLEAIIGIDGLVKETKLVNDAPVALARAAEDAVRQWEFDPTLLNCQAVDVRMSVLVDFR